MPLVGGRAFSFKISAYMGKAPGYESPGASAEWAQVDLGRNLHLVAAHGLAAVLALAHLAGAGAVIVVEAAETAGPTLSGTAGAALELVLVSFGAFGQGRSPPIVQALKAQSSTFVRKIYYPKSSSTSILVRVTRTLGSTRLFLLEAWNAERVIRFKAIICWHGERIV